MSSSNGRWFLLFKEAMTKTTERRISYDELNTVSVRCGHCTGEIRVDLRSKEQVERVRDGGLLRCPLCGNDFQLAIMHALKSLTTMRRHLAEAEQTLHFCLTDDDSGDPGERA